MATGAESSKSVADTENVKDVVVIGGGISGLSAAKLLVEDYGLDVVVLEARDRVGGRTWTLHDEGYGYTDVGGAYVGPTQRRVYRLATELGLELYCINQKERTVLDIQGVFMKYRSTIPPITNPIKALDLNNAQQLLNKLASRVPVEAPWKAEKAREWDSMTFQQFIDKHCWTRFVQETMSLLVYALLCVPPHEVSLLFVLWYIASGQGVQRLVSVTNGAQERKFKGGAQQLSTRMSERLGERVKLNQPVIRVSQTDQLVTVTCTGGETYKARHVINAMPLALTNRVTFEPPLPPMKIQLIQRVPMGSIIKTMMFYKTTFWKGKGLCGEMITDSGPILYCVDDTKPDGSFPCIMGFILANSARDMVDMTTLQRKEAICKHYAKVFRNKDFLEPVNYVEKNWMEEQYSGGCYVSALPPGVLTSYGHLMRSPHGLIHQAGTESATYWAGYMEGAIQAGERAAREVLHVMKKLSIEEIDREEPLCADFPEPPVEELMIERLLPSVTTVLWYCGLLIGGTTAWLVHKYWRFS